MPWAISRGRQKRTDMGRYDRLRDEEKKRTHAGECLLKRSPPKEQTHKWNERKDGKVECTSFKNQVSVV